MEEVSNGRSPSGRATAAKPVVSALRDGIPSAWHGLTTFLGPLSLAVAGVLLIGGSAIGDGVTKPIPAAIGIFLLFAAFDAHAERAKLKASVKWLRLMAGLFDGEHGDRRGLDITYSVGSLRPELDEIIAEAIKAHAISTDTAGRE